MQSSRAFCSHSWLLAPQIHGKLLWRQLMAVPPCPEGLVLNCAWIGLLFQRTRLSLRAFDISKHNSQHQWDFYWLHQLLLNFVSGTGTIVEGVWGGNGPKINDIYCQVIVALFLEGWGRACHPLSGVLPSFKVTHGWQK